MCIGELEVNEAKMFTIRSHVQGSIRFIKGTCRSAHRARKEKRYTTE